MSLRSLSWMVLPAVMAAFMPSAARAGFTVDNFTTVTPSISQIGAGTTTSAAVTGSGILGSRTIALTVASPLNSADAEAGTSPGFATAGFSGVYLSPNNSSNYTLSETFSAQNAIGNLLDFSIGSTTGETVTITANGTSTFSFTDPSSATGISHSIMLSSFSNSAVFANLTSLTFTVTFPNASVSGPSVAFTGPIFFAPSVPEPSSLVLSLTAGMLFLGRRYVTRRRPA
jgi:hypothetical protein